ATSTSPRSYTRRARRSAPLPAPFLAAHLALLAQLLQAPAQQRDSPPRDAAVALELGLARAARPDAAPEALEVLAHAAHAREVVLELRELHLELAFGADGVLREDVQDQLGPVDDAGLQGVLERSLLRRVELVVHEQHLRAEVLVRPPELLELALAQVGTPLRSSAVLDESPDRLDERCARKLSQLGQLALGINSLSQHRRHDPTRQRGARRAVVPDCNYGARCPSPPRSRPPARTRSSRSSRRSAASPRRESS